MTDAKFTEFMQARNDVLDRVIALMEPLFENVQVVADSTCVPTRSSDAPRTVDFRRGCGNHNARMHLCRKQIERDEHERQSKTLLALSREEEK